MKDGLPNVAPPSADVVTHARRIVKKPILFVLSPSYPASTNESTSIPSERTAGVSVR
jgi:hypothetical protein